MDSHSYSWLEALFYVAIVVAYVAWVRHVGKTVLTGRFEWLDRDAITSKVCKFILAFFISCFYVAVVIGKLMWKLIIESNK